MPKFTTHHNSFQITFNFLKNLFVNPIPLKDIGSISNISPFPRIHWFLLLPAYHSLLHGQNTQEGIFKYVIVGTPQFLLDKLGQLNVHLDF